MLLSAYDHNYYLKCVSWVKKRNPENRFVPCIPQSPMLKYRK